MYFLCRRLCLTCLLQIGGRWHPGDIVAHSIQEDENTIEYMGLYCFDVPGSGCLTMGYASPKSSIDTLKYKITKAHRHMKTCLKTNAFHGE